MMLALTNLLDRRQLSRHGGHFGFEFGNREFTGNLSTLRAGFFERLRSLGLVEVLGTNRRIGQHRHVMRLHFQNTAGYKHFFNLFARTNTDEAGLHKRNERKVSGQNPQFARLTGQRDELSVTRENAFFGADDVGVNNDML